MRIPTPTRLLVVALFGALQCTNSGSTNLAGSGVETTNAAISGYVFYPDSRPAYGAWATIWPESLNATPQYTAMAKIRSNGKSFLVGSSGKFTVTGVMTGSYRIAVADGQRNATIFGVQVHDGDTALQVGADTLRPFGIITGMLYPPVEPGPQNLTRRYVAVIGLDLFTYAGADGYFSIAEVPKGAHTIRCTEYGENRAAKTVDITGVMIIPGDTVDLDTIRFP